MGSELLKKFGIEKIRDDNLDLICSDCGERLGSHDRSVCPSEYDRKAGLVVESGIIKPCPFCGGEAQLNTFSNIYETIWSIACVGMKDNDCAGLEGSGFKDDMEELIKQWNKRPS